MLNGCNLKYKWEPEELANLAIQLPFFYHVDKEMVINSLEPYGRYRKYTVVDGGKYLANKYDPQGTWGTFHTAELDIVGNDHGFICLNCRCVHSEPQQRYNSFLLPCGKLIDEIYPVNIIPRWSFKWSSVEFFCPSCREKLFFSWKNESDVSQVIISRLVSEIKKEVKNHLKKNLIIEQENK